MAGQGAIRVGLRATPALPRLCGGTSLSNGFGHGTAGYRRIDNAAPI